MSGQLIFLHGGRIPRCITTVEKTFGYHLLQMSVSGGVDMWTDGRHEPMIGPHVWLCRPGPRYKLQESPRGKPWNHRYLAFIGSLALRWESSGLLNYAPQPLPRARVSEWAWRFDRLIDQSQRADRWSRLRSINLLEGILIDLSELREASVNDPPPWLSRALDRLSAAEPDYRSIAKAEHLSLSAFQRRFRKTTGQSPHAYRVQHRVAEARRLLGETDLPIKEIAERLGYRDVFYFTRQFKRHVGVPPATFRRSRQR